MKFGSEIDFGDIFASGLMALLLNGFVLVGGLWLGLMIGQAGMAAGDLVESGSLDLDWMRGPFGSSKLAIFFWMLTGVLGLGAAWFKYSRLDGGSGIRWGIFTGVIAALSLGMYTHQNDPEWLPASAAWGTGAITLGMLGTALWFMRQWQMNRWATELLELQIENAERRRELEEGSGTESTGPEPLDP
jgi:hypothetical protein